MRVQKKDIYQFVRFAITGGWATAVHMGVVILLSEHVGARPYVVHFLGFLVAFGLAVVLHHFWTFKSGAPFARSAARYFAVAVSAYALSNLVLALAIWTQVFPNLISVLLGILVMPPVVFVLSRYWAFAADASADLGAQDD